MSFTMTQNVRKVRDHFEPEPAVDPATQRQMRAILEQIDLAAYQANCAVLNKALPAADVARFERMATAVATARARWVASAMAIADKPSPPADEVMHLASLRLAYEELSDAYEALRRMVERGYVAWKKA
jgi:hypothetical protein